ncbi:MAG: high frequency lysogenization protein HflD [Thiogranum sp.]|nr:high frequency lysogenization protein HflD [Thiogranum sp.]
MTRSDQDRALAFAGIVQALQLVQSTAHGKPYDVEALHTSLNSVFSLDPASVEDVYGGIQGVSSGLRLLQTQLMSGNRKPDPELSRYLVTLLHLERKLGKRADLLDSIRSRVERVQAQVEHFGIGHANVIAALADAYTETVSTLRPRIMVSGDPQRLSDAAVANQIRALLLAAMRSAVLWRQCGGTRIGLLLGRAKLVAAARSLLA